MKQKSKQFSACPAVEPNAKVACHETLTAEVVCNEASTTDLAGNEVVTVEMIAVPVQIPEEVYAEVVCQDRP